MNTSYPAQALHNEKATDSSGSASNFKFRLVRICPATTRGAPVKCTLENMTLGNSEVDYNALSYNWGEKQNNAKIQLSGQPYFVTKNLYLALRHIRDPQKHQLFFIDALCINQNDVEERSSQVQRMFDVYRNATQVVVFLGEQRENTAQALSWITSAGEDLDLSRFDIIKGVAARTFAPSSSDQILIHQGLRDIMSRPWWRYVLSIVL
jgi:hypothetical protein